MADVILLLTTALIGFVLSYVIVTAFNIGGRSDTSLQRDLQQLGLALTNVLLTTVFVPLRGVWVSSVDMGSMAVQRWKWVVAGTLFTICTLLMHYYHHELLSIMDDGWTCTVVPVLRNIVTPILQISRVLYALAMPVVNAWLVLVGQFMNAWYVTLAKCSHIKLFRIFTQGGRAIQAFIVSLRGFFGADSVVDDTNNFYFNDFEFERPLNHTMAAVSVSQEVLACACKRFEPLFKLGFVIFEEPHVVAFLDNLAQTGIRMLQMLFRLLFPEIFPDVYLISFKAERAVMEGGLAFDAILFKSLNYIVNMFDRDFKFTVYPKESVGAVSAHVAAASLHTAATLLVNVPLHILGSFRSDVTPFDPVQWSLDKAFAHVHAAIYSSAVFIQWVVYLLERLMTDTVDVGTVFTSADTPLDLVCDWARDVSAHKYVSFGYTAACSFYNGMIASTNIYAIGYGAMVELLTLSLFTKEPQNVFRTLQRWEGPTLPRNKVYTCAERKAATAYNYATDVFNPDGWIWTQDGSQCSCERYYGTTADEDEPPYNPWCGQPSLNFDVFAPLDALVMHVSHGLLGPGFGDAFPFIDPIRNIEISIPQMGVDKSIALPVALPPLTRTAIESVRVLTRVLLSFGDIVTGHFFNYPSNCGHGLNMLQLRKKYEHETKSSAAGLKDEDMRWRTCKKRAYSAKQGSKRTPVCDVNNDDASCMCSYLQPLTAQSQCKCISRYPDLDVTSASQQVGDLIEKRFTSAEVSIHWCNSMLIEWTFQNTAAFADALDYMVSLGPLNPTCDVVDRILEGDGFDTTSSNRRTSSTYLVANTPTLNMTAEFTGAEAKLNTMKSLYAKTRTGCAIKKGGLRDATDEDGNFVLNAAGERQQVRVPDEWSCDASESLVSIADLDPLSSVEKPGCRIWGRNDFFCSSGLFVRNFKRLTMNLARQVVNDGISLVSGNFADVNVDTLPRLCDYERVFGAISAMVAGVIPRVSTELKQAFAKYINMALQLFFVQAVRTTLTITNMVTTMVMDFVAGTIDKESITATFQKGVDTVVQGLAWAFRYFWQTTGEILNAVAPGSGSICFTIVEITDMVLEQLKHGLMDVVALVLKVVFQMLAAVTGDTSVIQDMFTNIFELWAKVQLILIQQVWQILYKIFDFFGPVGEFFKLLLTTVCSALNFVFQTIDSIIRGLSMGMSDGIGWSKMQCTELKAGHANHTQHRLGRHFLGSMDNRHVTRRVAEVLDWNGTSVCDHFMSGAAEYAYTDLRPLEKAQWFECLELKLIGVEMAKWTGSKSFPTDIMYNWKTKYAVAFDGLRAVKIVLQHYVDQKAFDWASVRMDLYDAGLDADMYLRLFQSTRSFVSGVVHNMETTHFVAFILGHIDPKFDQPANPSAAAKAWTAYRHFQQAVVTGGQEWEKRDATQQMWTAVDATQHARTHLYAWWSALGTEQPAGHTHTERVFSTLQRNMHQVFREKTLKTKHSGTSKRPAWLRTPLRTGIKTCAERGNPGWCTDCNIADNMIETTLVQADAIGHFYARRFPHILNNVSAYFDDLGTYNDEFFSGVYSRLASSRATPVPKTGQRWSEYVVRDWSTALTHFGEFVLDIGNRTKRTRAQAQVERMLDATRLFVTRTNGTYVPFYGYSFYYMFDYLLFTQCSLEDSIFVTTTSETDRLLYMDNALLGVVVLTLVIVTNTAWSVIPLVWLANTVVIGTLSTWLYLYMVYGYQLNCAPLLPYTLMEDVNAWYYTRIQPGCFYKMLPHLVSNMTDDTCLTCSGPVLYQDCHQYSAALPSMLPLHRLIEDYNIFWPAMFWVRWQWPEIPIFLVRHGILNVDTTIGRLALGAWQREPIDPVWVDCYYAMWLDNVLAAVVVSVAAFVTFKLTFVMVQTAIQAVLAVGYAYTALGYMSLAIEQSVVT